MTRILRALVIAMAAIGLGALWVAIYAALPFVAQP